MGKNHRLRGNIANVHRGALVAADAGMLTVPKFKFSIMKDMKMQGMLRMERIVFPVKSTIIGCPTPNGQS